MGKTIDIAIIGGGIAGWSLAAFLSPHRSVLVLEREDAFGYHATGRSAAEFGFRFHTPLVGKLAALSFPFLDTPPNGFCQSPLIINRGMILIAHEEKRDHLAQVYETESRGTDRLTMLSQDEAIARAPILNPDFVTTAFHDPDCWDIEVETLFQAYQRLAKKNGAASNIRSELVGAKHANGMWQLETRSGTFSATTVVNAAGAWVEEVGEMFGAKPLGFTPLNRTVITVDLPDGIDWHSMPEVQEIDEDFYMKPDAGKLLLSPADETESAPCDAQPEELGIAWAMHWVNEATIIKANRPAHAWAGLRTFAPDRAPVIGWDKNIDGLFWLAGQGGFGIQTSPAVSQIATALLCSHALPEAVSGAGIEASTFSPSRFS